MYFDKCRPYSGYYTVQPVRVLREGKWCRRDGQCTYKCNIKARSRTIFAVEKQEVLHILESVSVALVIQHAKRMRHIILSFVACTAVLHFSTSNKNDTNLGKCPLNMKCSLWFSVQILSETFLILMRIQRDVIINVHWSSCLVTFILVRY